MSDHPKSFKELGITDELLKTIEAMGWSKPTKVQEEVLPSALQGRDIIALAETGSGKTGAFALPILQTLLENPQRLFALVLTPTRELAFQIAEQFEALGSSIGLKCVVIVGGVDHMSQAIALAKRPHIIIATPGRIVDHLENTKGFSINSIKYLVMDEADRILNMDFEEEIDKIINVAPPERTTYLFSATMSSKIQKLQRASLNDPVRVEVASKYSTVETLQQVALMLKHLGFSVVTLHGQMTQVKRLAALRRFKAQQHNILVGTDVASRGLDIPHVDVVLNLDVPTQSKDYIHRVGRTARAGRSGRAITIVSQYDVDLYQRIEKLIEKKLPLFPTTENDVMKLVDNVNEAERIAKMQLRDAKESNTEINLFPESEGMHDVPGLPSISSNKKRRAPNKTRNLQRKKLFKNRAGKQVVG